MLAQAFARGATEVGHEVETISLVGKKIGFCLGCWGCLKTHRCVIHDDADWIVQKMKDADVLVFATPIYYYEMSGQMKVLLDRTNCLYTANYHFKDIYLLTTAEATDPSTPNNAVNGLKGWLRVFSKAKLVDHVFAGGTTTDGNIANHPQLEIAYQMGKNI